MGTHDKDMLWTNHANIVIGSLFSAKRLHQMIARYGRRVQGK